MSIVLVKERALGRVPIKWTSCRGTGAMANEQGLKKKSSPTTTASAGGPPAAGARPFDKWLHKQLHAMYDEITKEPLPQFLVDLIERDAEKAKGPGRK